MYRNILTIILIILSFQCLAKRSESMKIVFQNDEIIINFLESYKDTLNRKLDYEIYQNEIAVYLHNDDDFINSYASKIFTHTIQLYHYLGYVIKVENWLPTRNGGEYIELYYEVPVPVDYCCYLMHNDRCWQNATLTEARNGFLNDKQVYTKKTILENF